MKLRCSVVLAVGLLFWSVSALTARAELTWQKPIQEFQVVPDQTSVEARFSFKNIGKTAVSVKSIVTSCGCTTARLDRKTYAPGESGEVVAVYKFPFQTGALRKLVTVTTDDGQQPATLDIRVFRHEPFEVKPGLVYWRVNDASEPKAVKLLASGYPVHVKSVTSSNPKVTATLSTVKDGEEYSITVKPASTVAKDAAEISVVTDFPRESPRVYTIHARVK